MMTIDYCITQATNKKGHVKPDVLRALLTAREDSMADTLRLAGAQFGLIPELVAEVVAELGMGTEPTAEERQIIRNNFIQKMQELQQGGGGQ